MYLSMTVRPNLTLPGDWDAENTFCKYLKGGTSIELHSPIGRIGSLRYSDTEFAGNAQTQKLWASDKIIVQYSTRTGCTSVSAV